MKYTRQIFFNFSEGMNHVNEIFFNVFKSFPPYMLYILDKKQYPILGMGE